LWNETSNKLTGATLLSELEIVDASNAWSSVVGIYFLVKGTKVVYVGQSLNVHRRISDHRDKDFDRYAVIQCPSAMLDKLESLYIHTLRPILNGEYAPGMKLAPLRINKLLESV
jgi:hypothetical protein